MRYCVVKDTTKIIDGSDNSIEIMLQNAQNAGFLAEEVEILAEEGYQKRLENEPKPIELPSIEERVKTAEETLLFLMDMNLIGGI